MGQPVGDERRLQCHHGPAGRQRLRDLGRDLAGASSWSPGDTTRPAGARRQPGCAAKQRARAPALHGEAGADELAIECPRRRPVAAQQAARKPAANASPGAGRIDHRAARGVQASAASAATSYSQPPRRAPLPQHVAQPAAGQTLAASAAARPRGPGPAPRGPATARHAPASRAASGRATPASTERAGRGHDPRASASWPPACAGRRTASAPDGTPCPSRHRGGHAAGRGAPRCASARPGGGSAAGAALVQQPGANAARGRPRPRQVDAARRQRVERVRGYSGAADGRDARRAPTGARGGRRAARRRPPRPCASARPRTRCRRPADCQGRRARASTAAVASGSASRAATSAAHALGSTGRVQSPSRLRDVPTMYASASANDAMLSASMPGAHQHRNVHRGLTPRRPRARPAGRWRCR